MIRSLTALLAAATLVSLTLPMRPVAADTPDPLFSRQFESLMNECSAKGGLTVEQRQLMSQLNQTDQLLLATDCAERPSVPPSQPNKAPDPSALSQIVLV